MPWKNALADGLPENHEEVIISIRGVNCQAVYHDKEKRFEDKRTGEFYSIFSEIIYWRNIQDLKSTG